MNEGTDLNTRDRRTRIAWGCIKKFSLELFDRPSAPWKLKVRSLKAEAMKALLAVRVDDMGPTMRPLPDTPKNTPPSCSCESSSTALYKYVAPTDRCHMLTLSEDWESKC